MRSAGCWKKRLAHRLFASAVLSLMSRVTLTLSHSFSWRRFFSPRSCRYAFPGRHHRPRHIDSSRGRWHAYSTQKMSCEVCAAERLALPRSHLSLLRLSWSGGLADGLVAWRRCSTVQLREYQDFKFFEVGFFLFFLIAFCVSHYFQVSNDSQKFSIGLHDTSAG
jgi:hypothetical protein